MRPFDHVVKMARIGWPAAVRHLDALPTTSTLSDEELYLAVTEGSQDALGILYDRYAPKVYSIARRLSPDEQSIEDVIQDVFTRIWSTRSFDPSRGVFEHWLAVVARRIAIDHCRRRRHVPVPWSDDSLTSRLEDTPDAVDNQLLRNDLLTALSRLEPAHRIVLQLAYFKGYTLAEVSVQLGIPLGTVKTRLRKGLHMMKLALSDWAGEVES